MIHLSDPLPSALVAGGTALAACGLHLFGDAAVSMWGLADPISSLVLGAANLGGISLFAGALFLLHREELRAHRQELTRMATVQRSEVAALSESYREQHETSSREFCARLDTLTERFLTELEEQRALRERAADRISSLVCHARSCEISRVGLTEHLRVLEVKIDRLLGEAEAEAAPAATAPRVPRPPKKEREA